MQFFNQRLESRELTMVVIAMASSWIPAVALLDVAEDMVQ